MSATVRGFLGLHDESVRDVFGSICQGSTRIKPHRRQPIPSLARVGSRGDPRRPLRERPRPAPWAALGGSLARSRAHVAARSAKRPRVRAGQLQEAREGAPTLRGGRLLVCGAVRRMARVWRWHRVAPRWSSDASCIRAVGRRFEAEDVARGDGLAPRGASSSRRSASRALSDRVWTRDGVNRRVWTRESVELCRHRVPTREVQRLVDGVVRT
jgi:hypothetical protein